MTRTNHLESDLYQAAFLIARGIALNELQPIGSRVIFSFENADGQATAAVKEYGQGASLPAREFAQAISETKTRLYQAKFANNSSSKGPRTERNDLFSRDSYR